MQRANQEWGSFAFASALHVIISYAALTCYHFVNESLASTKSNSPPHLCGRTATPSSRDRLALGHETEWLQQARKWHLKSGFLQVLLHQTASRRKPSLSLSARRSLSRYL